MDQHERLLEEKQEAYPNPIRREPLYRKFGVGLTVDPYFGYATPNVPSNLHIGKKRAKSQ